MSSLIPCFDCNGVGCTICCDGWIVVDHPYPKEDSPLGFVVENGPAEYAMLGVVVAAVILFFSVLIVSLVTCQA